MSTWLLIARHDMGGERLSRLEGDDAEATLERVTQFTSATAGPTDEEIAEALAGYARMDEGQELLLVSVESARKIYVRSTVDVQWDVREVVPS
jgi:hypothetical protein